MIEVSPSFSAILEEPEHLNGNEDPWNDAPSNGIALTAFMSDKTAQAALNKGFRLSTFRFKTKNGVEYEYAIQNVNDLLIPYKIEDILRKRSLQQSIISAENRGVKEGVSADSTGNIKGVVNGGWKQDPSKKDKVITYYAEIVGGIGFDGEQLFINYQVKLPNKGWELRSGDLNDGDVTETETTLEEFSRSMSEGMVFIY